VLDYRTTREFRNRTFLCERTLWKIHPAVVYSMQSRGGIFHPGAASTEKAKFEELLKEKD